MRKIVLAILVLFVCISVSCTKKAERKEEKKEAGMIERAIIGPIEKAKGIQEKSKERADTMEKQADDISGEPNEEAK